MEDLKLYNCVSLCRKAYADLIESTDDCNDIVDSAISLYEKEGEKKLSQTEKKNIKKLAKSLASEKSDSLKIETTTMGEMLYKLFGIMPDVGPMSSLNCLKNFIVKGDTVEIFTEGGKPWRN